MNIKPTRSGLLLVKKKLKLADKGYSLLKKKRDALVLKFFETLKEIKKLRKEVAKDLEAAHNGLVRAQGYSGIKEIKNITSRLNTKAEFTITEQTLMGVKIPKIDNIKTIDDWFGYQGSSLELDNSVKKYRDIFPSLMKLVEKQIALNKLSEDIQKTRRKVNSLEYILIPKMKDLKGKISLKLEEIERENFSRLQKIKELGESE